MYLNDDGETVRGMDILVPRVGEIIGGSQREHRLDVMESEIQSRLAAFDTTTSPAGVYLQQAVSWYADLRKFGSVPHSGFGLGFDRMVMYITGIESIQDTIPFPRTPGSAAY